MFERTRRALRTLVLDVEPLRTRPKFRWLFVGQLGAHLSRQILIVAVPYQVYVLTESPLLVGAVGLFQVLPLIVCSFLGGVIADAFDRHRVLMLVQFSMALTSAALALNSTNDNLVVIFALVMVNAGLTGMEAPTRLAIIPSLVSREQMSSAFALNQTLSQTMAIVGPALGGLLIAALGTSVAYIITAIGSTAAALAVIPLGRSAAAETVRKVSFAAAKEGWHYLRTKPVLWTAMVIDFNAMVFGLPRALFPVIGLVTLDGTAATVGLLHAALGTGSFLGAATAGWVRAVQRQGRIVVCAVVVWGTSIALFGLARELYFVLPLLAVAGMANSVSTIFRATILQLMVPDALRGRVTSFNVATASAGPQLGDAEAGLVAELTTPTVSVVTGGIASVIGAVVITWRARALWNQRADDP